MWKSYIHYPNDYNIKKKTIVKSALIDSGWLYAKYGSQNCIRILVVWIHWPISDISVSQVIIVAHILVSLKQISYAHPACKNAKESANKLSQGTKLYSDKLLHCEFFIFHFSSRKPWSKYFSTANDSIWNIIPYTVTFSEPSQTCKTELFCENRWHNLAVNSICSVFIFILFGFWMSLLTRLFYKLLPLTRKLYMRRNNNKVILLD